HGRATDPAAIDAARDAVEWAICPIARLRSASALLRGHRGSPVAEQGRGVPGDAAQRRGGVCRRGGGLGERAPSYRASGAGDARRDYAGRGGRGGRGTGGATRDREVAT